jgi:hypothetical protein
VWRTAKLFINLVASSIIFNYFVEILILLINPHICITGQEFLLLFIHLYLFYGPLWFIFAGIAFVVIQFFSEKKYPIGIYDPPTLTYFLALTVLVISFILYLNYDYYFSFFEGSVKFNFIRVLLINLALIITGIVFMFFKKVNRKWIQMLFFFLLVFNLFHSYNSVSMCDHSPPNPELKGKKMFPRQSDPEKFPTRKIRIVLMDGISLSLIKSLTSEQKLLNFNEIIKKGVSGRIESFTPNLDLSMLNAALTGHHPSQFSLHSHEKFKFPDMEHEFDVRPRFIFFRKSASINTTSFYKRIDNHFLDNICVHYENDKRRTYRIFRPARIETYSERSLHKNTRFVLRFPGLLQKKNGRDEKYEILKKCFFLDDYLKNMIPDLKDTDIYYSVNWLPGLRVVSKYFYQYHMPQVFGNISPDDIKIKKYGGMVQKYYEYYDSIIGNLMSTTGENELLVILSFYEYEPLPVWRRILVHLFSKKDIYVYKSLNTRGTILLYEKNALKQGYPLKTISIFDIYPTLIYYAGFQLSRDLQGEVLKEMFTDEFLLNNPIDINTNSRDNLYNTYPK